MINSDLRFYALERNVRLYSIAKEWGVSESYFFRMLREPFTTEQANRFRQIVDSLVKNRK